jgi:hypothetical protein
MLRPGSLASFFRGCFRLLASLKLAVIVLLGISVSLAAGTFVESLYDTPTAQYYVYRSLAFHALLAFLGVNILAVMLSRIPWKLRHTPFLLAHIGILTLLTGSFITERYGLDGSMRVSEGQTSNTVELNNPEIWVVEQSKVTRVPVPWIPPWVRFEKISIAGYDLIVDRYLSHADASYSFAAAAIPSRDSALQLRIAGGAMNITQDLWLYTGDPRSRKIQMGPAEFSLGSLSIAQGKPSFSVIPESDGSLSYIARSSEGKEIRGKLASNEITGKVLDPGWKGDVKLTLLSYLPQAQAIANYEASRSEHGLGPAGSAVHIVSGAGGPGAETWLSLGMRAKINEHGRELEIAYYPERVALPFALRLEKFTIEHYHGTHDPSEYSSNVMVVNVQPRRARISMNEPLVESGITVYQASFDDARPRPTTSIFAINRDPGRKLKYGGSLLIVLGTILLFGAKFFTRSKK